MMPLIIATILSLMMSLFAPLLLAAEDVDMVLVKTVSGERADTPGRYTVQPGDCVHRILRKMGLPEKKIPAYLRIVESANPDITDINLIRPEQVLIFPPPAGVPTPVPSPVSILRPEQAFIRLGETVQNEGSLYLPILETGTLALDSTRYPLITLDNGTVLILDAQNTVPLAMKDLIEKTLPKYRLVRLGDAASPEKALDRLLRQSNYSSIAHSKGLVLEGDVTVSLDCDRLIEKTPDSLLDGSIYAINYARYPREIIPKAVRDIAVRHDIQVVNIPESLEESSNSEPAPAARAASESLHSDSQAELVSKLLTRLGFPFLGDIDLTLYAEEGGGVTMTYKADILVEGARRLVVSFREIPPSLTGLMDAQEVDHAIILPSLSPQQTIVALLDALHLSSSSPQAKFKEQGSEGKNKFTITIPGVFLSFSGEKLLFTGKALEEQILAFLADQGVKVILY